MAKEWYLMDSAPLYNGGFEGEEWMQYAQQGFGELLDTSMLCDHVEFINSDFSVIVPGKAIIQSVTENTSLKLEDRQILTPIGTLSKYSYIRFNGVVWLIDAEPTNNKFYEKAPLKVCNNQLRWQDKKTKKIYEYWYWCEDITRYSSGVYEGNVVVSYDKQYSIHLPYDENTRKLHDGMRFMLEKSDDMPLVYKLTKFDGITGNNKTVKLLKLSLTQTVFDRNVDNEELMVADYFEGNVPELPENNLDYTCEILHSVDEISISSFAEFSAVFQDNEKQNINIGFKWSISDNDFDISLLRLIENENTLRIIAKMINH